MNIIDSEIEEMITPLNLSPEEKSLAMLIGRMITRIDLPEGIKSELDLIKKIVKDPAGDGIWLFLEVICKDEDGCREKVKQAHKEFQKLVDAKFE